MGERPAVDGQGNGPRYGLCQSLDVPEHECAAAGTGCPACARTLTLPYPAAGPRARQVEWLAAAFEVPVCLVDHDWTTWEFFPPGPGEALGHFQRRCRRQTCTTQEARVEGMGR